MVNFYMTEAKTKLLIPRLWENYPGKKNNSSLREKHNLNASKGNNCTECFKDVLFGSLRIFLMAYMCIFKISLF